MAARSTLPDYDQLPVNDGAPKRSSWGLWGDDDVFGCLNLLTPARVRAGVACARDGKVFNLNLELHLPQPPLFSRSAFVHTVHNRPSGHDDELAGWNTQSSSQWDGFRHIRHATHGFYNGVADESHGMHHWARKGIVGRAVLADVARWRASQGRPLRPDASEGISSEDLLATLDAEGIAVEPGDILLVRTGWMSWYRSLSDGERAALATTAPMSTVGLLPGEAMLRTLWDLHVAAVAADNPALEVWPPGAMLTPEQANEMRTSPEPAAEFFMHYSLLPLLGMPIGELFDFDGLAADCATDGRYACLFTSAPLNLEAGVASPPNALAVK
jgi:hypothetical protein